MICLPLQKYKVRDTMLNALTLRIDIGLFTVIVIICSIYRLFCAYVARQTLAYRKNSMRKPFVCLTYSSCSGQIFFTITDTSGILNSPGFLRLCAAS